MFLLAGPWKAGNLHAVEDQVNRRLKLHLVMPLKVEYFATATLGRAMSLSGPVNFGVRRRKRYTLQLGRTSEG